MKREINKQSRGQFHTSNNPFKNPLFFDWWGGIPNITDLVILEPYAGSNNIVGMISELSVDQPKGWVSYDIEPNNEDNKTNVVVKKRNTIYNYPKGYSVCITNPPYLAKNAATRNNLHYPTTTFDNLYKFCLHIMLKNNDYVACIIPESFITQNQFMDRLYGVISLNVKMFEDTDCPVCLALFKPRETNDFQIYIGINHIGSYGGLVDKQTRVLCDEEVDWVFNNPDGNIGLFTIDDVVGPSIRFCQGPLINKDRIKPSSRSLTRVSGPQSISNDVDGFVDICNSVLKNYRIDTHDLFMTSFRGLRKDGMYRRRLSFAVARDILNSAYKIYSS